MLKRQDVYFPLYASTKRQACIECWRASLAFFAWGGLIFFCLGNGASDEDWFQDTITVKDLVA